MEKPHVGQRVKLNDEGKRTIGGLTSQAMIDQAASMTVTGVFDVDMGHLGIWDIEVDQPLINRFILSNEDLDPIDDEAQKAAVQG